MKGPDAPREPRRAPSNGAVMRWTSEPPDDADAWPEPSWRSSCDDAAWPEPSWPSTCDDAAWPEPSWPQPSSDGAWPEPSWPSTCYDAAWRAPSWPWSSCDDGSSCAPPACGRSTSSPNDASQACERPSSWCSYVCVSW